MYSAIFLNFDSTLEGTHYIILLEYIVSSVFITIFKGTLSFISERLYILYFITHNWNFSSDKNVFYLYDDGYILLSDKMFFNFVLWQRYSLI